MPDGSQFVRLDGLKRYFDVSAPWLVRAIEGRPRQIVQAVDGVDIRIAKGETFSLVGESGCGKSTVARLVVGLYPPTAGSIEFDGNDMAARRSRTNQAALRRRMQMIFQDPFASLNPRWRVFDIIAEPIRAFGLASSAADLEKRVGELLRQVRLTPADGRKYPHEFSGGQRQRISIARALAANPEFLVCDEPTSALDVSVQAQILNLMRDLQRRLRLTYLFISHNLAVIYQVSDRVGVMYLGRLVEVATADQLFTSPRHPYTRLLLETIPRLDPPDDPLGGREPVAGEVPNPIDPPPGCAFHPRCPYANDRCRRERPSLLAAGGAPVACHAVQEGRLPTSVR
jgi:peptide/nickel transport system ATP-binding protein